MSTISRSKAERKRRRREFERLAGDLLQSDRNLLEDDMADIFNESASHINENFLILENEGTSIDQQECEVTSTDIESNSSESYDHDVVDDDLSKTTFDQETLSYKLGDWMSTYAITRDAGSKLLHILHPYHQDLSLDPRTLLGSMRCVSTLNMCGGVYYYNGLVNVIRKHITQLYPSNTDPLILQLNVDGIPLYKSSSGQFWPILLSIDNSAPVVLALFYGTAKPNSLEDYLRLFLDELKQCRGLVEHNGKEYHFQIGSFICDAPARSFLKQTIGHTGYFSCERCCVKGERVESRTVFLSQTEPSRTGVLFDEMAYEDTHQTGRSPLIGVVDCVAQFGLDYMHLVCLGVVRRMISFWRKGKNKASRLNQGMIATIASRLVELSGCLPSEFSRQPRSLLESDRWKATEFRTFILYTGSIVLKGVLSRDHYEHFCTLSIAMNILLEEDSRVRNNYLEYARGLLHYFVDKAPHLYGSSFVTYNVHGLIHLVDDCKYHNCSLNKLSAFPFENMLGSLKRLVRGPHNPVVQVVKRLSEASDKIRPLKSVQKISSVIKDSMFMLRGGIIVRVMKFEDSVLHCHVIPEEITKPLFTKPLDSKLLHIVICLKEETLNLPVVQYHMADISKKMGNVRMDDNYLALFPLRHTM